MEEKSWFEKGLELYNNKDYEQAVECFLAGDKAGDADCTEYLGRCYFWGLGVETDLQKAAFYNEKAAKAGIPSAMYDTALNYERGQGVQQDINRALYWLTVAANEEYADAFLELGNIYYYGDGVKKDHEKSFKYYQQGAELGEVRSKTGLAEFYIEGKVVEKDLEKAKKLYQEAFDSYIEKAVVDNDSVAQFWLGTLYSAGLPILNIAIDYNQAADWYLKAAQQGHDDAQNNLGIMYIHGIGVAQDYKQAFEWFIKAAERKNVIAMSNVANCYYSGKGVGQDFSKAAEYHSKAAHLECANSQEVLGEMYLYGKGIEQNDTKAAYWLKAACTNGERSAYAPMGDCYLKGQGVEKNENKAFELYEQGASMGNLRSKVAMAECLIEGWGTKCDDEQAFKILTSICHEEENYRENLVSVTSHDNEKGITFYEDPLDEINLKSYAKAYYLLGLLCYSGNGRKKDAGEAIRLLRTADKLGYQNDDAPEETVEKLLTRIMENTKEEDIRDTVDCYVEVRERREKGERYEVVLHHADGTENVVKFRGRNKFFYILALLIAHEGKSVCGLTTLHFEYMHNDLVKLAEDARVRTDSYNDWINEFVYGEKEEKHEYIKDEHGNFKDDYYAWLSPFPYKYSNASSAANKAIKACCVSEEEYETFMLRSTKSRSSITTISLDASQIILPDSLMDYLDCLPTQKEIASCEFRKSIKVLVREESE